MSEILDRIPARVLYRAINQEQLRNLIQADLGEIEPFFWPAEISNNNLDFYFGRMAESTLRNFAQDATAGVSFLDSHNSGNLGYGQSLQGVFEAGTGAMRAVADFYTVPGIRFNGGQSYASTDDFIMAVKSRLVRDVSVGVYGGERICDICGQDMFAFDWENWRYLCPHIPGVEYPVGDRGESVILATFQWENGRLAEVSAVYDGATPGAAILKATRMVENVEVPEMVLHQLEVKYRMKMPEKRVIIPVAGKEEQRTMDELEQVTALLGEANATGETVVEQVRWLIGENARLVTQADEGKQYRSNLIDEAITEGVRALGNNFPADTYRKMFEGATIEMIRSLKVQWQGQADALAPEGRRTQQEDETGVVVSFDLLNLEQQVPVEVYK